MPRLDLSGILTPVVTPFDAAGDFDAAGFRENLCCWSTSGIRGVVIGGSTGEAILLDADERRLGWQIAVDEVGSDLVVVAGAGAESTRAAIAACRGAAEAGVHAVLVKPPAFYRGAMTSQVLLAHYRAVAEASPMPVILYQVPLKMSTIEFPTEVVAELSHHPNIIGIKDSRGSLEKLSELIAASAEDFQVIVGNGALLLEALDAGAVGGILGVANVVPDLCAAIHEGWAAGHDEPACRDDAARIQTIVAPLHTTIVGTLGVPGVKAAVELVGRRAGAPRPPLQPLGADGVAEVRALLETAGVPLAGATVD